MQNVMSDITEQSCTEKLVPSCRLFNCAVCWDSGDVFFGVTTRNIGRGLRRRLLTQRSSVCAGGKMRR